MVATEHLPFYYHRRPVTKRARYPEQGLFRVFFRPSGILNSLAVAPPQLHTPIATLLTSTRIMASDEIVWQIINQQFCSFKLK